MHQKKKTIANHLLTTSFDKEGLGGGEHFKKRRHSEANRVMRKKSGREASFCSELLPGDREKVPKLTVGRGQSRKKGVQKGPPTQTTIPNKQGWEETKAV